MNPVHLRTLEVVLATGSFADAARQLGYTPSAVSQQISTLERDLRLSLFEREAHGIRPTAAALEVAERAVPALSSLRALDEDLRLLAGGTIGRLRIGSFPTASQRLLPAALSAFRRRRPRIEIDLDEAEPQALVRLLDVGDLDVALVYVYGTVAPRWARGRILRPILEEDLLLLSRSQCRAAGRRRPEVTSLEDMVDETWIATRADTQGAATMERLCRQAGFDPDIHFRSNDYAVLQGLVAAGMGVAMVPGLALAEDEATCVRRVAGAEARRIVSVVFSPGVPTELGEVFTAALRRSATHLRSDFLRVGSSCRRAAR